MTADPTLFDVPGAEPPPPAEPLSPDRRRTARQHAAAAAGVHPLALVFGPAVRVHPDPDRRCGNCQHRGTAGRARYPKCLFGYQRTELPARHWRRRHGATHEVSMPRVTSGAATDVRAWWPGCTDHQPTEPATGEQR